MDSLLLADLPGGCDNKPLHELQEAIYDSNVFYKCRLCLEGSGQGTSGPSWSRISSSSERVRLVTKISVLNGDGFPAFICDQCSFELDLAHTFIQRSVASDNVLRSGLACAMNTMNSSSILSRNRQHAVDSLQLGLEVVHDIKEEPEASSENDVVAQSNSSSLDHVKIESEQAEDLASMPNKCRLCLGRSGQLKPISTFAESIAFVACLTVRDADGLPAFVCGQCTFELSLADGFIRRCAANDRLLQSAVASSAIDQDVTATAADPLHIGLEEIVDLKEEPLEFYVRVKLESEEDLCGDPLPTGSHTLSAVSSCADSARSIAAIAGSPDVGNNARSNKQGRTTQQTFLKPRMKRKLNTKFTCKLCSSSFKLVTYYNLHLRTHTAEERSTAACFDKVKHPLAPAENVGTSKLFSCAVCGKSYVRKGNMLNHAKSHIAALSTRSSESYDEFGDAVDLNVNVKKCSGSQKCCKCGEGFAEKSSLAFHYTSVNTENHLLTLKVKEGTKQKAKKCSVEFSGKHLLASHTERDFLDFKEETASSATEREHNVMHAKTVAVNRVLDKKAITPGAKARNVNRLGKMAFKKSYSSAALNVGIKMRRREQNRYKCNVCDASFNTEENLFLHTDRYENIKAHRCEICGEGFELKAVFESHKKLGECSAVFECRKCHKAYQYKGSLMNHMRKLHKTVREAKQDLMSQADMVPVECVLCGLSFLDLDDLTSHLVRHANETLSCTKCVLSFATMESFMNHMIEEHHTLFRCTCKGNCLANVYPDGYHTFIEQDENKTENLVCDICKISFTSKKRLMKHISFTHTKQRAYRCRICGRENNCRRMTLTHELRHYYKACTSAVHVCKICNKLLQNRIRFKTHMRHGKCFAQSKPFDVPLRCVFCDLTLPDRKTFSSHIEMHASKDLTCSICHGNFVSIAAYKKHMLETHYLLSECICCKCGGKYVHAGALRRHFVSCPGPGKNLQCVVCGLQLSTLKELTEHLTAHGKQGLECEGCTLSFNTLETFMSHMMNTHYQLGQCVFCKICGSAFTSCASLDQHSTSCQKNTSVEFSCDSCKNTYSSRRLLLKHIFQTLDENEAMKMPIGCSKFQRKCVECGVSLPSADIFLSHMTVHGKNALNCTKCAQTFPTMAKYMQHVTRMHYPIRQFVCEKCGHESKRNSHLKQHSKVCQGRAVLCHVCGVNQFTVHRLAYHVAKHGKTKLECSKCNLTFVTRATFITHMFYTHYNFGQCVVCEKCIRVFDRPETLKQHQKKCRKITTNLNFACSGCSKCFLTQRLLNRHARKHVNDNNRKLIKSAKNICTKCRTRQKKRGSDSCAECRAPPQIPRRLCKLCFRSFLNTQSLKRHVILVHTDPIPYHCDICGHTRATKKELKRHIIRHLTVHRLQCHFDNCNKTFYSSSNRETHLRTHTGERPFSCAICNKCFSMKLSLKKHIDTVHLNLKPFQCNLCELKFSDEHNLIIHLKMHL